MTSITEEDKRLAADALRKRKAGETPTRQESAALKRYEQAKEDEQRWRLYRSIPQKHWREMSGRPAKVVNEQAVRYGLPFDGPTVDLPHVVRALHDFLAKNSHRLGGSPDDALMEGGDGPALERYRAARAELCELELAREKKELLPKSLVHPFMRRVANGLRECGDALKRMYGEDAHAVLDEALKTLERETEEFFSGEAEPEPAETVS